jgi:hypothetical protein
LVFYLGVGKQPLGVGWFDYVINFIIITKLLN